MKAPRVDRRVVDFRTRGEAGVMAELQNVVRKKNGSTCAFSRGFVRRIGVFILVLWAMQQVTSTTPTNPGRKRRSPGSILPRTVWKPQPR